MKILIFLFFTYTCCFKLNDDLKSINDRYYWNRNHTKLITNNLVEFEYSNEKGTHCKANQDLYKREFVFTIPSQFIICGFDMFPFKFEFAEAIQSFFIKENNSNQETHSRIPLHAIYLMYVIGDVKEDIQDLAKEYNLNHYIFDIPKEFIEYIQSLPKEIYTLQMYGEEEIFISKALGLGRVQELNMRKLYDHINKYILEKFPHYSDLLIEWISDYNSFVYFNSIVASRAYKLKLDDYENLRNIKFSETPKSYEHLKILYNYDKNYTSACLIPFFDLCNHRIVKNIKHDKIDFFLHFTHGKIEVGLDKDFKAGEEYDYSYIPESSNMKLLLSYGFYDENNFHNNVELVVKILRNKLTYDKYLVAKDLNLFITDLEEFYKTNKYNYGTLEMLLFKHEMNNVLLNICKLMIYPDPLFNYHKEDIKEKIFNDQWISYDVEIRSYALYREYIRYHVFTQKLKLTDVIYSLHITRMYYKKNRDEIIKNDILKYKHKLRRKIMNVGKENLIIINRHEEMIFENMNKLLSDQFKKIKNFYVQK